MRMKPVTPMILSAALLAFVCVLPQSRGQSSGEVEHISASSVPQAQLIQPEELRQLLKSSGKEPPLIVQVGSRVFFSQKHIPGAQYAGPASQPAGIASLENLVSGLQKDKFIVLYCGCCPWNRCPNVGPAYKRLHQLGFSNVKVLYLANNFGDDWVSKGYPAVPGK